MIHDFYHNTRAEIKEHESDVKNFDTKMQELEEAHRVEIKVYMQKVKHLEYEHSNNCERVQAEAQGLMKDERNHHMDNEKDMKKEKKTLKEEYNREESSNIGDVEEKEKELEQNLKDLNKELELKKKGLI